MGLTVVGMVEGGIRGKGEAEAGWEVDMQEARELRWAGEPCSKEDLRLLLWTVGTKAPWST